MAHFVWVLVAFAVTARLVNAELAPVELDRWLQAGARVHQCPQLSWHYLAVVLRALGAAWPGLSRDFMSTP
jgi:hypothetical protein